MTARLWVLAKSALATVAIGAATVGASGTASADAPLAGRSLIASSPAQPICGSPRELADYTLATIRHADYPLGTFPTCVTVNRGTPIQVVEDLGPHGTTFHVVKVRADTSLPFPKVYGYTYSVGLYPPYYNAFREGFRLFP